MFQFTLCEKTKEPVKSRVTDIVWIPLLVAVAIGYIVIAAIDMNDCVRSHGFSFSKHYNEYYIIALSASLGSGLVLSLIYMVIVHKLVKFLIVLTLLLHTVFSIAFSVYYGVVEDYIASFIAGICGLLGIVFLAVFNSRIKSATRQWEKSVKITLKYPTTFLSAIIFACFASGIAVLTGIIIFSGHAKLGNGRAFEEYLILVIYITIGGYLLISFGKVVVRASVACVYGYWYFTDRGPKVPLISGLKQALTFSVGSLCAVSLVLTAINVGAYSFAFSVDLLINMNSKVDLVLVVWAASLFLTVFDWLFQIISLYTTIFIAIYNCTYLEGTQRSVAFLSTNFVNEALTGGIFMLASRSVGSIAAFICYVYLRANQLDQSLLVAFVELAATQLCSTMLSPVIIGVQTLSILEAESKLRESLSN